MAFCTKCGNQVPDGVKFCTLCGAPIQQPAVEQQPVQSPPVQSSPVQSSPVEPPPTVIPSQPEYAPQPMRQPLREQPAAVYTEEPISTGGYVGIFLLLMLPVINIICLIIWACGGCRKVNKRNMARAMLIWMIIGAVLSGILFLIITLFFASELDSLKELATDLGE